MTGSPDADRAFIERSVRRLIVGASVGAGILLILWLLKSALTPLAAAFAIAYFAHPVVLQLERLRISRRLAIVVLLLAVLLGVFLFAFQVVPRMVRETADLSERLPGYVDGLRVWLAPRLESWIGIELPDSVQGALEVLRSGDLNLPVDTLRNALRGLVGQLTGTLGSLVGLLVIPVLAFYALADFERVNRALLGLVPRAYQETVAEKLAVIDKLVSSFVRGQLTVCLIDGVLYAAGFLAIGVPQAVVIGLASGLLALIPYVGGAVALTSSTALCLFHFGVDYHVLLAIGWYALVQGLEGFVLVPRILGASVGMHPVTVIVALLIFGDLLGFLGLLIAVPAAAVVQVFVRDGIAAYRKSPLYRGSSGAAAG